MGIFYPPFLPLPPVIISFAPLDIVFYLHGDIAPYFHHFIKQA